MFRKTNTNLQFSLFTTPSNILPKRAKKKYTDEKAWHNQLTSSSSWSHPRLKKKHSSLCSKKPRWVLPMPQYTSLWPRAFSKKVSAVVTKICLKNASLTCWPVRLSVLRCLTTNCLPLIPTICSDVALPTTSRGLEST